jgi:hypothetical protein
VNLWTDTAGVRRSPRPAIAVEHRPPMEDKQPLIDWRAYLRDLSRGQQVWLESTLAEKSLSLGEFMELAERALIEARVTFQPKTERELEAAVLQLSSALLTGYSMRKRMFSLKVRTERNRLGISDNRSVEFSEYAAAAFSDDSVAAQSARRRRIHDRIEAIKKASEPKKKDGHDD